MGIRTADSSQAGATKKCSFTRAICEIARIDHSTLNDNSIIVAGTILGKMGEKMELVSYHHDHTTSRSKLGYQMLQAGRHNGARFYPVDFSSNQ